jgi:hypothetical protein
MAVLAGLYSTQLATGMLQALPQEQLLQAAIIADMLQAGEVTSLAIGQLLAAQGSTEGWSLAAVQEYLRLRVLPSCLLPFFCHVMSAACGKHKASVTAQDRSSCLLRVLGDLEQVWASKELQDVLLGLPLAVVRELLSRTELEVGLSPWRCCSRRPPQQHHAQAGSQLVSGAFS